MERPFNSAWLARCSNEKERSEFKEYLLNCRKLWDELEHLIAREEQSISRGEVDYSDASWAFKMAHYNGMREAISRIRQLIP